MVSVAVVAAHRVNHLTVLHCSSWLVFDCSVASVEVWYCGIWLQCGIVVLWYCGVEVWYCGIWLQCDSVVGAVCSVVLWWVQCAVWCMWYYGVYYSVVLWRVQQCSIVAVWQCTSVVLWQRGIWLQRGSVAGAVHELLQPLRRSLPCPVYKMLRAQTNKYCTAA